MASIRLRLGLTQPRTVGVVQRLRQVSKLKPSRFSPFYTSLSIIAYRLSTGTDRQDQLRESLTVFFSYFHTVSSSPLELKLLFCLAFAHHSNLVLSSVKSHAPEVVVYSSSNDSSSMNEVDWTQRS